MSNKITITAKEMLQNDELLGQLIICAGAFNEYKKHNPHGIKIVVIDDIEFKNCGKMNYIHLLINDKDIKRYMIYSSKWINHGPWDKDIYAAVDALIKWYNDYLDELNKKENDELAAVKEYWVNRKGEK